MVFGPYYYDDGHTSTGDADPSSGGQAHGAEADPETDDSIGDTGLSEDEHGEPGAAAAAAVRNVAGAIGTFASRVLSSKAGAASDTLPSPTTTERDPWREPEAGASAADVLNAPQEAIKPAVPAAAGRTPSVPSSPSETDACQRLSERIRREPRWQEYHGRILAGLAKASLHSLKWSKNGPSKVRQKQGSLKLAPTRTGRGRIEVSPPVLRPLGDNPTLPAVLHGRRKYSRGRGVTSSVLCREGCLTSSGLTPCRVPPADVHSEAERAVGRDGILVHWTQRECCDMRLSADYLSRLLQPSLALGVKGSLVSPNCPSPPRNGSSCALLSPILHLSCHLRTGITPLPFCFLERRLRLFRYCAGIHCHHVPSTVAPRRLCRQPQVVSVRWRCGAHLRQAHPSCPPKAGVLPWLLVLAYPVLRPCPDCERPPPLLPLTTLGRCPMFQGRRSSR